MAFATKGIGSIVMPPAPPAGLTRAAEFDRKAPCWLPSLPRSGAVVSILPDDENRAAGAAPNRQPTSEKTWPTCLSDRCSECGLRFIEAGVVKGSPASRVRLWIGVALIMLPPLFGGLSATMYMARKAAMERAKAQAAAQFLQQVLSAHSARSSAATGRSSGE